MGLMDAKTLIANSVYLGAVMGLTAAGVNYEWHQEMAKALPCLAGAIVIFILPFISNSIRRDWGTGQ